MNKKLKIPTKTQASETGQNGNQTEVKLPAEAEIRAAFRFVYDTLEGMMLQNHYALLGEAARAVRFEDYTPIPGIEVGIQENRMTPEVKETLRLWKYQETEKGWEQTKFNVPILFRVIKRKYQFFQNPDQRYFDVDEYKIPNPFSSYWKARFIIQ